MHKKIDNH